MNQDFPLELISAFVSFVVIFAIVRALIKYKKHVAVIDGLYELSKTKKLTKDDKEFITSNLQEYKVKYEKQIAFNKLMYPAFILVAGIFFMFFEFKDAIIHLNIIVVTYIYLAIKKIHYKNYITLLEDIKIR